jgi:uncharacterized membrane protein YfcA
VARSLLIVLIAFGCTLIASMSGGSASLLSTPAWLALGFPLPTAIAGDKFAATLWTALSARNYFGSRKIDKKLLVGLVLVGLVGVAVGTLVATSVKPALLRKIVGGIIIVATMIFVSQPTFGLIERSPRIGRGPLTAAALPLGFYEGLLGSGNGIFSTLLLVWGRGYDLRTALGYYYVLASVWCGFAAISYGMQGFFDLSLALPALVGAVIGGYLGSRVASRVDPRFVRILFVLAGLGLGVWLLFG